MELIHDYQYIKITPKSGYKRTKLPLTLAYVTYLDKSPIIQRHDQKVLSAQVWHYLSIAIFATFCACRIYTFTCSCTKST